jgi:gliding motility-associated-like protein
VANSDQATTHLNTSVTINLIANDTDSDGTIDKSSVDINTSLAGIQKNFEMEEGSLTVNEEGIATFTPAEDFSGTATVNYTVKDNKGTVSNVATIIIEVRDAGIVNLDIPNGFTPNGDGANETWKILTSEGQSPDEFENAEIRVYSKQGVLVYHAKGFGTQWDGKHNGKVLPADTYFYTIDLPDNGVRRKGIVTILR